MRRFGANPLQRRGPRSRGSTGSSRRGLPALVSLQLIKNIAEITGTAMGLEPFRAGSRVNVEATHADCALHLGGAKGAAFDPNVIRKKRQQHCDCHPSTTLLLPHCEYQQDASAPGRAYGNRISHNSEVSQSLPGNHCPHGCEAAADRMMVAPPARRGSESAPISIIWG